MGKLVNRRLTNIAAGVVAAVNVSLNVYLLATG
jgi:Mn2+/Fe2+ NRAMP family transporter